MTQQEHDEGTNDVPSTPPVAPDHYELVREMKQNDKLPVEDRIRLAKLHRVLQLSSFTNWDHTDKSQSAAGRGLLLTFPDDVYLLDAACKGELADMQELLDRGLDPNTSNQEGLTALHQCSIDGREELVELLLQHGAGVNVQDRDGWTPLHAAATCGHLNIVKMLIEHEADLLAVNGDGDMPFDITEDEETLFYVEDAMTKSGITHDMVTQKRDHLRQSIASDVQLLIDEEGDLDTPVNEDGATLLHIAVVYEYNDIVKLLLENGASDDIDDVEGWRPIHAAAFWNNKDAVELLVDLKQTDLRAVTDTGSMAFEICDDMTLRNRILELISEHPEQYATPDKDTASKNDKVDSLTSEDGFEESQKETESFNFIKEFSTPVEDQEKYAQISEDTTNGDHELTAANTKPTILPSFNRVESVSTKRNSIRQAKKHAPTIRLGRNDTDEIYDNSYDLMLTKSKKDKTQNKQKDDIITEATVAAVSVTVASKSLQDEKNEVVKNNAIEDTNSIIATYNQTPMIEEQEEVNRNTMTSTPIEDNKNENIYEDSTLQNIAIAKTDNSQEENTYGNRAVSDSVSSSDNNEEKYDQREEIATENIYKHDDDSSHEAITTTNNSQNENIYDNRSLTDSVASSKHSGEKTAQGEDTQNKAEERRENVYEDQGSDNDEYNKNKGVGAISLDEVQFTTHTNEYSDDFEQNENIYENDIPTTQKPEENIYEDSNNNQFNTVVGTSNKGLLLYTGTNRSDDNREDRSSGDSSAIMFSNIDYIQPNVKVEKKSKPAAPPPPQEIPVTGNSKTDSETSLSTSNKRSISSQNITIKDSGPKPLAQSISLNYDASTTSDSTENLAIYANSTSNPNIKNIESTAGITNNTSNGVSSKSMFNISTVNNASTSQISSSTAPVVPVRRKKHFDPLPDLKRPTPPASAADTHKGSLQSLKLKRQQSRQDNLMQALNETPEPPPPTSASSIGGYSGNLAGGGLPSFSSYQDKLKEAAAANAIATAAGTDGEDVYSRYNAEYHRQTSSYKPPDSPTRIRHVFKDPTIVLGPSIVKKKKKCIVM